VSAVKPVLAQLVLNVFNVSGFVSFSTSYIVFPWLPLAVQRAVILVIFTINDDATGGAAKVLVELVPLYTVATPLEFFAFILNVYVVFEFSPFTQMASVQLIVV
jgi:hypothetical protein